MKYIFKFFLSGLQKLRLINENCSDDNGKNIKVNGRNKKERRLGCGLGRYVVVIHSTLILASYYIYYHYKTYFFVECQFANGSSNQEEQIIK